MKFKNHLIFLIFAMVLIIAPTAEAGDAKIWDTIVKDEDKFYAFEDSLAWANKANWVQVPYGTTAHTFTGSAVLEDGNFWLYLHDTHSDSPFMYANVSGTPGFVAELYGYYNPYQYPSYAAHYTTILTNTADEIMVKHTTSDKDLNPDELNNITYRIVKDGGWIELKRTDEYYGWDYTGAVHSGPNRCGIAPGNDGIGNDFVIDPWFELTEDDRGNPPQNHFLLETNNDFMLQDVYYGHGYHTMYMLTYSNPSLNLDRFMSVLESTGPPRLHAMAAAIESGYDPDEAIYFGIINYGDVFHTEDIDTPILTGGKYESTFTPPIAGRWRMSGRVDGEYYTSDVYDGDFTFTSPVSGTLEILVMYLYDRTESTPSDVNTPMDIYRDVIGQTTPTPTPTPPVQEQIITDITAASGEKYVLDTLDTGKLQYIDRSYTFSSMPSSYADLKYIRTANDDTGSTGNTFLEFNVNRDVTVYVAHDDRISPKPSWLASFTDTGDDLVGAGGTFSLYADNYSAGHISLGGNTGDGSSALRSMYNVVLEPLTDSTFVNNPPELEAIGDKIVDEGQSLTFTLSATDANEDVLTFSASNLPDGAMFDQEARTFQWTPDHTQSGTYTDVHLEVSDGTLTDFETITITVNNVNREPTFTSGPANGSIFSETDSVQISIMANDPDNDPLNYIIKIDGIQVSTTPSYTWTTNDTNLGYHNIELSVSDGTVTVTETLTIYINNIDQELIITGITAASGENYGLDTLDTGKLQYIDRKYTFSSMPSSYADLKYIRTANDDTGSTGNTFLEFNVNRDVTVYVAHDDRISPKPSWLASFTDTGDDLVGGGGTFSIYANKYSAGHISLGGNTGDGSSALRSMYNVILEPLTDSTFVNNPPELEVVLEAIGDKIVDEGQSLTFTLSATDANDDVLTFSASNLPDGAMFDQEARTFQWTPDHTQSGTYTDVYFEVSDGTLTDFETITITVNNVNREPTFTSGPANGSIFSETDSVQISIMANDPDNDPLNYIIKIDGIQVSTTSSYTWTTNDTNLGYHNIELSVSDGTVTVTETLTIYINNIDQELIITDITAASGENYGLDTLDTGKLQYIDRSYTFSSMPSSYADLKYIRTANDDTGSTGNTFLEFNVNRDVTVYVAHDDRISPKPSWLASFTDTGDDLVGGGGTFSIYANKYSAGHISLGGNTGDGSSALRSMYNVILEPLTDSTFVNNPPELEVVLEAIGDKIVDEGQSFTFTLSAIDANDDVLTFSASNLPDGAMFDQEARTFQWTPDHTQSGTYTDVYFEVSDGTLTDFETITITVNNVNREPTFTSGPANGSIFSETDSVQISIMANDPDNDPLNYIIKIDGIQVSTTSSYTWTTNDTNLGYHNIELSVSDGTVTVTETLTIYINNIDQELIITGITAASGEKYVLDTLDTGKLQYIDRSYTFSSMPSSYADLKYIRTANDDTGSTGNTFLEFNVNRDVTVYVAHDDRISPKPSWLASFTDTGDDLVGGGGTFSIYADNYSAGHISLGGNTGDGSSALRSMYNVILEPLTDSTFVNNPPELEVVLEAIGDKIVDEGQSLTFTLSATDANDDVLTFSASNLPDGAMFDQEARTFQWTPDHTQSGTYTDVYFEVSDGTLTDFETITITVNNVNREPTFTSGPANGSIFSETDSVQISIMANDPDNDPLNYIIKIDGIQVSTTPSYTLITNDTKLGYHNIELSVSDGTVTVTETLTIYINNIDQELIITGITAASGEKYVLDTLDTGKLQYIDRSYTFSIMPPSYADLKYIRTANDDTGSTGNTFLEFDVDRDVTVYVAHDDRISPKPSWLASFTDTGDDLVGGGGTFSIYANKYSAGHISLGGNTGDGSSALRSMYNVILEPLTDITFVNNPPELEAINVIVTPSSQIVTPGQTFNLNVTIDPLGKPIAGAQLDIAFDQSILNVNSITEGNLFKQNGASTFFSSGEINNSLGTVTNIFGVVIGNANVSTPGTFIIINMTAINTYGPSGINLSNLRISDPEGAEVVLNVINGNVSTK